MSNSSTHAPTPGQPIPTPPEFTVDWDDPRDAKLTWMAIPQYKTPISPLIHAVIEAFLVGGNASMEQAGLPFEVRVGRINTYAYMGMVPKDAPPEAVMKAMGLLNRAAMWHFVLIVQNTLWAQKLCEIKEISVESVSKTASQENPCLPTSPPCSLLLSPSPVCA